MADKDYRNDLKRIFTGYRRLTPQIERELAELGISVGRKQNHVVLFVYANGIRHSIPISSTGGDKREGLNVVTKIMRTLGAL